MEIEKFLASGPMHTEYISHKTCAVPIDFAELFITNAAPPVSAEAEVLVQIEHRHF